MAPRIEETDNGNFHDKESNFESIRGYEKVEKSIVKEQNGSINLELGSYKAVKLPLCMIAGTLCCNPYLWKVEADPRMEGLPLLNSTIPTITICLFYVIFSLVWGPQLMRNRRPIKLKRVIMAYNLFQVCICSYTFIQAGRFGWFWDYNYTCQPLDPSFEGNPFKYSRIFYLYFLTKILDLLDTVFFVLNKKWTNITLLHVGHHGVLVSGMFFGIKYTPGGHATFVLLLNSFVHALMYSYYFLSGLGPSLKPFLWWKKYLTMIQLIQFIMVFLHALQVFFNDCQIPKFFQFFECLYAVIFFVLFMDFYRDSYRKRPKTIEKIITNGIHHMKSNGVEKMMTNGKQGLKVD